MSAPRTLSLRRLQELRTVANRLSTFPTAIPLIKLVEAYAGDPEGPIVSVRLADFVALVQNYDLRELDNHNAPSTTET